MPVSTRGAEQRRDERERPPRPSCGSSAHPHVIVTPGAPDTIAPPGGRRADGSEVAATAEVAAATAEVPATEAAAAEVAASAEGPRALVLAHLSRRSTVVLNTPPSIEPTKSIDMMSMPLVA